MVTPEAIILEAINKYRPVRVVLMVSGGHDSITNAYISAEILNRIGVNFEVYHGDTTIGIPATQDYVKMICDINGWKLSIRKPPQKQHYYRELVLKYGFPGPTKVAHQIMYRCLKERALNAFVTYECKSKPLKRENVLLLTGIRNDESKIRMGYKEYLTKVRSKVWASPIFYMSSDDCNRYMEINAIPRNPVKDKMCISGECLCGAFDKKEEFAELKYHYPDTAELIEDLHKDAISAGHPWPWGMGPTEWRKQEVAKSQININFMCVGCDLKKSFI